MRTYLAAPTAGVAEFNHPAMDAAAGFLTRFLSHEVHNPAEQDRAAGFDPAGLTGNETLPGLTASTDVSRAWLGDQAEAICLMPGWEESPSARADLAVAASQGLLAGTMAQFGNHAQVSALEVLAELHGVKARPPHVDLDENHSLAPLKLEPAVAQAFAPITSPQLADEPNEPLVPAAPFAEVPALGAVLELLTRVTATSGEVRMTSTTGAQKGSKIARYDLIPAGPLWRLATLYGQGASLKYADRNWEKGYDLSLSFAALNRHLWAWWNGEDIDPEMGVSHLTCVAWHAFTLMQLVETHPEFDNRPAPITLPTPLVSTLPVEPAAGAEATEIAAVA